MLEELVGDLFETDCLVIAPKVLKRFWSKVLKTDSCWLWQGKLVGFGYGQICVDYKRYQAHRFSYIIAHGSIPKGQQVLHRCDTPRCVNPAHLFLGTQADNVADCVAKGRHREGTRTHPEKLLRTENGWHAAHPNQARGSRSPNAKLTEENVLEIRRRLADGESQTDLGREFKVNRSGISAICRRVTWRWLNDPTVV